MEFIICQTVNNPEETSYLLEVQDWLLKPTNTIKAHHKQTSVVKVQIFSPAGSSGIACSNHNDKCSSLT